MTSPRPSLDRGPSQENFTFLGQNAADGQNAGRQGQPNSQVSPTPPTMSQRSAPSPGSVPSQQASRDDLSAAKKAIAGIESSIAAFLRKPQRDTGYLIRIFESIKAAQRRQRFDLLQRRAPGALNGLSGQLTAFLSQLSADIDSGEWDIGGLQARQVHALFHGLSVIVGESGSTARLSQNDFGKLGQTLQHITERVLNHVRHRDMERKHWDNSQLINALNWISRGLKRQVLSPDTTAIRRFFTEALLVMKDWIPSSGESIPASTVIAPLDTRQLGKCMVQIATAMKFDLIDTETPGELLSDLILGLCGGRVLDRCTRWEYRATHQFGGRNVLVTIEPDGAELTNISNTIKDGLQAGLLDINTPELQIIIAKLCTQIQSLPEKNFPLRGGQLFGNCCNFLREIFESAQLAPAERRHYQKAYDQLCSDLLDKIPRQLSLIPKAHLGEQTLPNVFSFVKAMDKSRAHSAEKLDRAAACLAQALPNVLARMRATESISSTLSALQHFAIHSRISRRIAVTLMHRLIDNLDPTRLAAWPRLSRAMLISALAYCYVHPSTPTPSSKAGDVLAEMMQILFDLPHDFADRLPYLKAAVLLMARDKDWIARHQRTLRRLLPEMPENAIRAAELQLFTKQLQDREESRETASPDDTQSNRDTRPAPGYEPVPETKAGSAPDSQRAQMLKRATLTEQRSGIQEKPARDPKNAPATANKSAQVKTVVGLTRLVEPETSSDRRESAHNPTRRDKTQKKDTTPISANTSIASSPRINTTGWQLAKRTIKRAASETVEAFTGIEADDSPLLASTEPRLHADQKPRTLTDTTQGSGTAASLKKTTAPTPPKAMKPAAANRAIPLNTPQTPAQEWFALLRQGGQLSNHQIRRLEALLAAHPELATAVNDQGNPARSALFYALHTGKAAAVDMIARLHGEQGLADVLLQVVDETLFVSEAEEHAFGACMSVLSSMGYESVIEAVIERSQATHLLEKMPRRLRRRLLFRSREPSTSTDKKDEQAASAPQTGKPPKPPGSTPAVKPGAERKAESTSAPNSVPADQKTAKPAPTTRSTGMQADTQIDRPASSESGSVAKLTAVPATPVAGQPRGPASRRNRPESEEDLQRKEILKHLLVGQTMLLPLLHGGVISQEEGNHLMQGLVARMKEDLGPGKLESLLSRPSAAEQASKVAPAPVAEPMGIDNPDPVIPLMPPAMNQRDEQLTAGSSRPREADASGEATPPVMRTAETRPDSPPRPSEEGFALLEQKESFQLRRETDKIPATTGVEQNVNAVAAGVSHATTAELDKESTLIQPEVKKVSESTNQSPEQPTVFDWQNLMLSLRRGAKVELSEVQSLAQAIQPVQLALPVARNGMNALMVAAANDRVDIMELLLAISSVHDLLMAVDLDHRNALDHAMSTRSLNAAKLLLTHPSADDLAANLDDRKQTPLMRAAISGDEDIVELILNLPSARQLVQSPYIGGLHATGLATLFGHYALASRLREFDKSSTDEAYRAPGITMEQQLEVQKLGAVESGMDLPTNHPYRWIHFHHFLHGDPVTASEKELRRICGNDPASMHMPWGSTPLMEAVARDESRIAIVLLELDPADRHVLMTDHLERNALMHAAIYGAAVSARLLLRQASADAQVMAVDSEGRNPLMLAAMHGQEEIIELMLQQKSSKAQAQAMSHSGLTAMGYAIENGHKDIAVRLSDFI